MLKRWWQLCLKVLTKMSFVSKNTVYVYRKFFSGKKCFCTLINSLNFAKLFFKSRFFLQNFFGITKKPSLLSKMLPVLSRQCPKEAGPVHNNCRHPKWLSAIVNSEILVALSCLWIFTSHICHISSGEKTLY